MHRLTNNWNLKLISLVLAVLLWSHVRGEVNPLETTTVDVPLLVRVPRGYVLVNNANLPEKVSVVLRGPRVALRNIKGGSLANPLAPSEQAPNIVAGALRAHLDWTSVRAGEQMVPIKVESDDPDVEALGAKPAELQVTLDRAEGQTMRVQPRVEPKPAAGLSVQGVSVSPATAAVCGAAQTLARVSRIQVRLDTRVLDVGSMRESQGELLALDAKGNEIRDVRIFPETVQVRAMLREERIIERARVQVHLHGTPATGFEAGAAIVEPARVLVRGRRSALARLAPLAVVVDVSGARDTIRRRLSIDLPRGVTAVGARFLSVTVPVTPLDKDQTPAPRNDNGLPQPQTTPATGASSAGASSGSPAADNIPVTEAIQPQAPQAAARTATPTPRGTPQANAGFY
jgi:YbbR domain-containing protein